MVAANPNDRLPSAEPSSVLPVNRLAERVRRYFDRHPELAREKFLLEALRREIALREQREIEEEAGLAQPEGEKANRGPIARPRLTAEDVRIHAWLSERVAAVYYERHGLWPRLRRFLLRDRLLRWLGATASANRG
jgi:hypothetical protein